MKKILSIIIVLMLVASPAFGSGALMPSPKWKAWDSSGNPCSGCRVCTFAEGTTTNKATYSDQALTTPNTNPVVLDSRGEATIFLNGRYKIRLQPRGQTSCTSGSSYWTVDNISSVSLDDVDVTLSEWKTTDATSFTYISGTSFSVSGDYTGTFEAGRRIYAASSGDLYGRISSSSYASGVTTVTVVWDSGSLNAGGITDVEVSVVSVTNPSVAVDSLATGTTDANITSSGSNTWSGAQVFSGTETHSGAVTLSGGLTSSGTTTISGTTVVSGAATLSGGLTSSSTTTISGGGSITGTYAGNHTLSGVVTASGGLTSSGTTTVSGAATFSDSLTIAGLTSSGTITGSLSGNATSATNADTLDSLHASSFALATNFGVVSSGVLTITSGGTQIVTQDLGTLSGSEVYLVYATVSGTKGGTAGLVNAIIQKVSGTGSISFTNNNVHYAASEAVAISWVGTIRTMVSGTLTLELRASSAGSDTTSASGFIHVIRII